MSLESKHKIWTTEELDEFHSILSSFLSFIDEKTLDKIAVMSANKFNSTTLQPIFLGHITAVKRAIDNMLQEHGGRFYNPTKLSESYEK